MKVLKSLIFLNSFHIVLSAKILAIVSTPSFSHQNFFRNLWDALIDKGHEITLLTTHPRNFHVVNHFREIDLSPVIETTNKNISGFILNKITRHSTLNFMVQFLDTLLLSNELELDLPEVQKLINNQTEHFDLLIVEDIVPTFLAFGHRFRCPVIGVLSIEAPWTLHRMLGNAVHPVLYPYYLLSHEMNFLQRIKSVFFDLVTLWFTWNYNRKIDEIVRNHFGADYPSVEELTGKMDMLFVNSNPIFSPVRPFGNKTISISRIHIDKEPKNVPEFLKDFLSRNEGFIFLSLGSNVKNQHLFPETKTIIFEVLRNLPYNVLWKLDGPTEQYLSENIKIVNWTSQQDILRHPNIKLFITQGGLQSLEEAIVFGVPMIVMPFFGDQFANAEKIQEFQLGLSLQVQHLSKGKLKKTIENVICNRSIKNNVQKWAELLKDEPFNPLEKAVWYTEHVLRKGNYKNNA